MSTMQQGKRLFSGLLCLLPVLSGLLAWNLGVQKRHETLQDALFHAVRQDDIETVKALLAQGADANAVWVEGSQHADILDICRQKFSKRRRGTERRYSALMEASRHGNIAIATLLLNAGADVNAHTAEGYTPLLYAASTGAGSTRCFSILFLAEHGANIDVRAPDGRTACQIVDLDPKYLRILQHQALKKRFPFTVPP